MRRRTICSIPLIHPRPTLVRVAPGQVNGLPRFDDPTRQGWTGATRNSSTPRRCAQTMLVAIGLLLLNATAAHGLAEDPSGSDPLLTPPLFLDEALLGGPAVASDAPAEALQDADGTTVAAGPDAGLPPILPESGPV